MTWQRVDEQLALWSIKLVTDVRVTEAVSRKLGTTIASDVRFLPHDLKREIAAVSPIPPRARVEELIAFQASMNSLKRPPPAEVRAQVVIQNYLCFVYLPESVFRHSRQECTYGLGCESVCNLPHQWTASDLFAMLLLTQIGHIEMIFEGLSIGREREWDRKSHFQPLRSNRKN